MRQAARVKPRPEALTHFDDFFMEHDGLELNACDKLIGDHHPMKCEHPDCKAPVCRIAWVRPEPGSKQSSPVLLCDWHFSREGITAAFRRPRS